MSVDIHIPDFKTEVTLSGGMLRFCEPGEAEAARFLDFVATHPEHTFKSDSGTITCSWLWTRYIETGCYVAAVFASGDLDEELAALGWVDGPYGMLPMNRER